MKVKIDILNNKRSAVLVAAGLLLLSTVVLSFFLLRSDDIQNSTGLTEVEDIDAATLDGVEAAQAFEALAEDQEGVNRAYFYENSGDKYFDTGNYGEAVTAYAKAKDVFRELGKEADVQRLQQKEDQASFNANFEDYELEDEGVPFVPGETEPGQ